MLRAAVVVAAAVLACGPTWAQSWAQDIAGVEDCTKTSGLDRRTSCLQSNINFLQRVFTRNALDAQQRLSAAAADNAALRNEVAALRVAVAELRTRLEQLQGTDKKPPGK